MQAIRSLEQAQRRRMRDSLLEITGDDNIKISTRATYNGQSVDLVHLDRNAVTLWPELPFAKNCTYHVEGNVLVTPFERLELFSAEVAFDSAHFALCYACSSTVLNRLRSFLGMPLKFGSPRLPRLGKKELVVKGRHFADYYLLTQRIPLPKLVPCVAPHYVEVGNRVYLFHPTWSKHLFKM